MKLKKLLFVIALISGLNIVVSTHTVIAQYRSESNQVKTRVGNPTASIPGSGDVPAPPTDIRQGLIDEFDITMNGFDQAHLLWAWEKFWETTNTKFPSLVRGSVIESFNGVSHQTGCYGGEVTVKLNQYSAQDFFKFMITHELGHAIRNCNESEFKAHLNAYAAEGGCSYYGNHAADYDSDNYSEDYADMIAYYLNPQAGLATSRYDPNPNPPNPFFSGSSPLFPEHLKVVERILKK